MTAFHRRTKDHARRDDTESAGLTAAPAVVTLTTRADGTSKCVDSGGDRIGRSEEAGERSRATTLDGIKAAPLVR